MYLNILVKDLAGIPRYFHLDHMEIPSLIMLALEQATFHPPRNINPSSTVFTPPYNK
ncbi:2862_t:CDS:2 [Funneliformis geosporum]|uniref:2862_t:CDS:1 n=1 Tax=Funneliformis geosporum TaxID=1117311 RepID=A0A9W4SS64_9GLOM|nr:2862_t:CDS:2 [Funneliformis geosporum]